MSYDQRPDTQKFDTRLLAFYDQKVRETVERLERLERTEARASDPETHAATVTRLRQVIDETRRKAARIREARLF